ncbi:hypothetical protein, partial [Staphylococcus saprophyticus]|uniref:hypothetical protein n=1 Tax=Staphylococcus saprophyticus TaxID=29385 RepID=UPI001C93197E
EVENVVIELSVGFFGVNYGKWFCVVDLKNGLFVLSFQDTFLNVLDREKGVKIGEYDNKGIICEGFYEIL